MLLDIVENEVACGIDNIKTSFASGRNGIPPKFIKMSKVVLVPIHVKLCNKCVKEECFSDDFNLSKLFQFLKQLHQNNWTIFGILAYISSKYIFKTN